MKKIIPESVDRRMLILIGIFIISLSLLQPWVRGDGIHYYAYIRSLVIDGDLRFENEFKDAVEFNKFPPPVLRGIKEYKPTGSIGVAEALLPLTKTGYTRNQAPVGAPLLWSPFFLLAHLLVIILNRIGIGIPADGYSFPYIFLVSIGSCLYGFIGLILGYKICRRYFSGAISLYATASIWWASSIPAYMYGHPLLSHTASVFCVSLLIFLFLRIQDRPSSIRWLGLGFVAGLAIIVRIQDALFLLIPLTELLRQDYRAIKHRITPGILKIASKNILFLTGFLFGILPQLIVGKVIYGVYTLDFYRATQKEFAFNWFSPPIFRVLFSSWHGLFSW
ncbi:MAG: glycosyltransferase family 39 protein, partial [Candidatus Omnitrophota bacterium]|nr:glycosyltransferase family 39 protein [Candidatus Omnitrophota bacterium]